MTDKLFIISVILLIITGISFFIEVMAYEKQQGYFPEPKFNATSSSNNITQDNNFTYTYPNGTTVINRNSTVAKLWAPWRFITG